jgi:hypothetical protein
MMKIRTNHLRLDRTLNLTLGEKFALKMKTDLRIKKRGYLVSTMKTDTHTQVNVRCFVEPLV